MLSSLAMQGWSEALASSLVLPFLAWPHATTNPQFSWVWETLLPQVVQLGWARSWSKYHSSGGCCCWVMKSEREKKCEVSISILLQGHSPPCPQPVTPTSPGFPLHCQSQPQSFGRGSQPGRDRLCISPYLWCMQPTCPIPQRSFLFPGGGSFGDLEQFIAQPVKHPLRQ